MYRTTNRLLPVGVLFAALIVTAQAWGAPGGDKVRLWPDNLFGVDFVSASVGYVSGYAGTLLRTRDGGRTWQWSHAGVDELLRRMAFVDEEHGWAVGHRGSILNTEDGGESWAIQHQQAGVYLRDIAFFDRKQGWAVGHDATILVTGDGGETWQQQALTGFKGRDLPRLHGVVALDAERAVVVGEFGVVAVTADGGATWPVQKAATNKTLLDVAHLGGEVFVVAGLDGTLLRLQPGAADAEAADERLTASLIQVDTQEHFFAVTDAGHGRALATGRSVVTLIEGEGVTHLVPDATIQLPFTWFAGVDLGTDDRFWLVGIRGAIASGSLSEGRFSSAAALGSSDNVRAGGAGREVEQ